MMRNGSGIRIAEWEKTHRVAKERSGESAPAKGRILLVDDDSMVLEAHAETLRRLGYFVAPSQNPLEAFALFKENPQRFDLLVADEIMPHMRGTEMAAQIRRLRGGIPVVIITGGFVRRGRKRRPKLSISPALFSSR
jgi:CheY-like chemotaxis protein